MSTNLSTNVKMPEVKWFTYGQAREWQRTQALRQSDVPIEHAVSLPLPTRRWTNPGYAQFAAPSTRTPDQPTVQGAPDRWWVFDARGGRLIVYALTAAKPLVDGAAALFTPVEINPSAASIAAMRDQLNGLSAGMDAIVRDFFEGRAGEPAARRHVSGLLATIVPPPLMPQYRALVPDFFTWLES